MSLSLCLSFTSKMGGIFQAGNFQRTKKPPSRIGGGEETSTLVLIMASATWMSLGRKLGSIVRISGLFHLLVNGIYWGYNPLIPTIDTNHPGTSKYSSPPFTSELGRRHAPLVGRYVRSKSGDVHWAAITMKSP